MKRVPVRHTDDLQAVDSTFSSLRTRTLSNGYVFDMHDSEKSFYSWPELTYSPTDWLRVGLVAQRTKAFQTKLDTQRGFLLGFSHKQAEFTTYVFNPGWTDPTVVLEVGWSF